MVADPGVVSEVSDVPFILCVGTRFEDSAAIARLVRTDAVVLVAPDAESAIALLAGWRVPRRRAREEHRVIRHGDLGIDLSRREASWRGTTLMLSARELDLLATLASDLERVWTFEELTTTVWRTRYLGDSDAVVSAVKRLRRHLEAVTASVRIASVRAIGYRLVVDA